MILHRLVDWLRPADRRVASFPYEHDGPGAVATAAYRATEMGGHHCAVHDAGIDVYARRWRWQS
jgi:hypothetical protein